MNSIIQTILEHNGNSEQSIEFLDIQEEQIRITNLTLFMFPIVDYSSFPIYSSWQLAVLYKEDTKGSQRCWVVQFDSEKLLMKYGVVGGSIQTAEKEVIPKGGKTLVQQAFQEAKNLYKNKYDDNYRPCVQGVIQNTVKNPALAETWEEGIVLNFPVSIQPKYDGIRYLVSKDKAGKLTCRTRNNLEIKYFSKIREILDRFFIYLPEGTEIDGELYAFGYPFEFLSSVIRTVNFEHSYTDIISYMVFDINIPQRYPFEVRYSILFNAFERLKEEIGEQFKVVFVPTYIINREEDLMPCHDYFVSQGFEGAMIRKNSNVENYLERIGDGSLDEMKIFNTEERKRIYSSVYRAGRTKNLLKMKMFKEDECLIISAKEGSGKEEGCIIFGLIDKKGNIISVHPKGTLEGRKMIYKDYLENRQKYYYKEYTIKFFELTSKGVPRFPVGLRMRDYEGEDRKAYEENWSKIKERISTLKKEGKEIVGNIKLIENPITKNIFTDF